MAAAASGKPLQAGTIIAFLVGGIAFVFGLFMISAPARAYREARMFQLMWNNVGVSTVARFKCELRAKGYVMLRVRNVFLTLLTLGFFRPFAMVSEYRMKTEAVTLHVKGGLDQLVGQLARQQGGLGDAVADAVGLDLVGHDRADPRPLVRRAQQPGAQRAGQPAGRQSGALPAPARTRIRRANAGIGQRRRSAGRRHGVPAARRARWPSICASTAAWKSMTWPAGRRRWPRRATGPARATHANPLAGIPGGAARRGRRAGRASTAGARHGRQPRSRARSRSNGRPRCHSARCGTWMNPGSSPANCPRNARRSCANASTHWRARSSRACSATAATRRVCRCRSAPAWAPTLSPCPAERSS